MVWSEWKIGNVCVCVTHFIIASYWNVLESIQFAGGFHEATINCPKLIEFIVDQSEPQLIVVFLLHGGHNLATMFQHIGFLEAGHEMSFNYIAMATKKKRIECKHKKFIWMDFVLTDLDIGIEFLREIY